MANFDGRINRLFGTDGGVMLSLYASFPEEFNPQDTPLIVKIDSLDVPLWCDKFERRGISGATASFADFDTERRAEELLGLEFRAESPHEEEDDDEFYMEDLIGFDVEIEGDTRHAQLSDYYDSEENPLFGITIDGREILVPAVEEFIAHIDFENGRIRMVLPEGLIDLE